MIKSIFMFLVNIIRRFIGIKALSEKSDDILLIAQENYWANVFNSTINDSVWLKYKSFSPGRYAANYSFLYLLYRVFDEINPSKVLEFGLGQSSKISIQYKAAHEKTSLEIIEHNKPWIDFFLKKFILPAHDYVIKHELEDIVIDGKQTLTYKNIGNFVAGKKYDLIIVDGPYGHGLKYYARPQLLEILKKDALAASFIVIIDDYQRAGEKTMVALFLKALEEKGIKYCTTEYAGEKTQCVICSPDYEFVTTF